MKNLIKKIIARIPLTTQGANQQLRDYIVQVKNTRTQIDQN
jgi:hypothetical protein